MPAILDSLFHKLVNTTSIPIGVQGGGGGEVPIQNLFYGQMASIQAVFSSTRLKIYIHRCPVSPASPVVIPSRGQTRFQITSTSAEISFQITKQFSKHKISFQNTKLISFQNTNPVLKTHIKA